MPGLMLEDFDTEPPAPPQAATSPAVADQTLLGEDARTAAFEEGYQAGWDDAVSAHSQDRQRIGAEFARNLQELSFTFHEARAHVLHAMEPLLNELVNTVLPGIVAETFALTVQEELRPLIASSADVPIDLVVAPGARTALEGQIAENAAAAIRLVEEPTLVEGQAFLRIGKVERQVDLSGALTQIRAAAAALHELNERTLQHA
ncbi:flagellar biosynthesis protein [Pseudoruegeria sp. HB172150]|uniref:flagellar biosynthesis protein n=1 Tax=Pseudoruegeria sp. HB172150 TaxID=2721164 RepID=UPI001551EDC9|nr:flagellar biosynthesis protein [Pseudoruegeria sp. HB172150]